MSEKLEVNPKASAIPSASESEPRPSPEEIARRAYEIYLERGATDGQDMDDWLRAERELTEELEAKPLSRSTAAR